MELLKVVRHWSKWRPSSGEDRGLWRVLEYRSVVQSGANCVGCDVKSMSVVFGITEAQGGELLSSCSLEFCH